MQGPAPAAFIVTLHAVALLGGSLIGALCLIGTRPGTISRPRS